MERALELPRARAPHPSTYPGLSYPSAVTTFVFDIGETLVSDERHWADWADWLGVSCHTLSALVGAVVAQGRDNADALRILRPGLDVTAEYAAREAAGRGEQLDESDLYPDVRPALAALRADGHHVVIVGNQTVRMAQLLRELDLPADEIATSGEWGVAKPAPEFFARVARLAEGPVVYVGDHPANDIAPAAAAGLQTVHIRRGPWGYLWADQSAAAVADWRISDLMELVAIGSGLDR